MLKKGKPGSETVPSPVLKLETANTVTNVLRSGLEPLNGFRDSVFSYPSVLEGPVDPVLESLVMNVPSLLFKKVPITSPFRLKIPETPTEAMLFCAIAVNASFSGPR